MFLDKNSLQYPIDKNSSEMLPYLRMQMIRNTILEREQHRREMEQMKKEIIEDVLSCISLHLENDIPQQLRDILNTFKQ